MSSDAIQRATVYGVGANEACEGNDARLGTLSSKWRNSGVVPTATAVSTSSVTCLNLPVKPGDPVRILDKTGLYFTLTTPNITANALTGLVGTLLDYRGSLYAKSVGITATSYRYDIYSDEPCLYQIGTTSAFDASATATNVLTVTAVNGSGLGGTITAVSDAGGRTADVVHRIGFMRKGICTIYALSTGLLTFAGQPVTLTAGQITEVWLGDTRLVVNWPIDIGGAYASADAADAFVTKRLKKEFWDLPNGVLVMVKGSNFTNDTGATQAKIAAVIAGVQVVADGSALVMSTARVATAVEMPALQTQVTFGNQLGLRVLKGTNGNSSDLEGHFVVVLD